VKIVVFGPDMRVGALVENKIVDLNKADSSLPANLADFIAAGRPAIAKAKKALAKPKASAVKPAKGTKLHAPWAGKRIAMVGGNYPDHLAKMNANMHGLPFTEESIAKANSEARQRGHWGFWKVLDRLSNATDNVPFPKRTQYLDFEGEVAIVIGKKGKDIPASKVKDYVWGVTLVNDWSIRDGRGTPRTMSYNTAKNFDGSCTMGPCIVVDEVDFNNVDCETRVNGELRQQFNTRNMIFNFGEVLEFLSQDFTFVPGDVISGGTAQGTAADSTKNNADGTKPKDLFLKKGDVVEVSSPQIGSVKNKLV
jgi:2-keto-4-pentenoate hydratase/2-oxohepta-3-ene-1,7-dioic acid hydratase in catechol pathway